jgi:phytoene dehydrogenase-like protein
MAEHDGIIIGAGPNGLTVGAYLAKAGLKILLLDRRYEIGGGLATEMVTIPGFLHNTHAVYMPMVDYAPPTKDLKLDEVYDLKFVHPPLGMAMPFADGSSLCLYSDVDKSCESIAQFSPKDAETYRQVYHEFNTLVEEFLAPATFHMPMPAFEQVVKLQSTETGRKVSEFTEKTPQQIVEELFEHDKVRTILLYAACMWGLEYDLEGLGYLVPLMINRATNYRLVVGGSHHLAHLMYKFIYRNGGRALGSQLVKRIIVEDGTATGVEMEDGTVHKAKFVASSLDPYQTFLTLVGEEHLDDHFVLRVNDWKWEWDSLFVVHFALDKAPQFTAASSNPDLERAFIHVVGYESEQDLINHWEAVRKGELMEGAGFNCCFPSVHDSKQAPPGRHTGLVSQFAPYRLAEGGAEAWYRIREEHAERCVATLRQYAPNMTEDNILWHYITTPLDIENKFPDMGEGSIKQGGYLPLQMGFLRPNEECSQYATPIKNLYVCGASNFPGGLITFGPGYNAANRIAEDLGVEKWWEKPQIVARAEEQGLL